MDDDCWLPFRRRPVSELTQKALLAPEAEVLRNGLDRPDEEGYHGMKLKAGETVVYAFEQPEAVAQVRLVFDSDLNRETEPEEIARLNRNMIHNRPLGWPQAIVPKTLPEAYRILGVKEDGTKEILAETTRVHQRLMVHGVAGRYQAIVLEILKTRGETCGLFAMDLK